MKHILFMLLFITSLIVNTTMAALMSVHEYSNNTVVSEESNCHSSDKSMDHSMHHSVSMQDKNGLDHTFDNACSHCDTGQNCFCSAHLVSLPFEIPLFTFKATKPAYERLQHFVSLGNQPDQLLRPPRHSC